MLMICGCLSLLFIQDGGLEELADEFNSGKIQYALARVKIKEKHVEKIVLVNWVSDNAIGNYLTITIRI